MNVERWMLNVEPWQLGCPCERQIGGGRFQFYTHRQTEEEKFVNMRVSKGNSRGLITFSSKFCDLTYRKIFLASDVHEFAVGTQSRVLG